MRTLIESNRAITFIVLAYSISWFIWCIPVVFEVPKDVFMGIAFLGGFGPASAGFILLHYTSGEKIRIKSKPLFWLFFSIVFLVFFMVWLLLAIGYDEGWVRNDFYTGMRDLSVLGAALLLTFCFLWGLFMSNARNDRLKENYLRSFLFDKSKVKWYLFALLIYPVTFSLSYFLGNLLGYETSEQLLYPGWVFPIAFILTFFTTGSVEEFGWRGFLQKEAQKITNPLLTSLLIAVVWMVWHWPLHVNGFYPADFTFFSRISLALQFAFLFTWFYNRSGYSILTVMILHAMNNNTNELFGRSHLPAMAIGILWIVFFIIDNKMWRRKEYHEEVYD